jgi:hypothetical protein
MFAFSQIEDFSLAGIGNDSLNPAMVGRIRRLADGLNGHEIAACLADAIRAAADAAHACDWQESCYGEASPDAQVDREYHDELAAAWSLVASENQMLDVSVLVARWPLH